MNLHDSNFPKTIQLAFFVYKLAWCIAIPFLRHNKRLRHGFSERTLQVMPDSADLWLQAASVGESFLAWEILKKFDTKKPIRILLTTCTSQGMEILIMASNEVMQSNSSLTIQTAYFPFDNPKIMSKAVNAIKPRVMLLLESELWPGLLRACKTNDVRLIVANGRMTERSLIRYMKWPSLWQHLSPDKILAMSAENADRFSTLFGEDIVEVMDNIKFDRINNSESTEESNNPIGSFIQPDAKFIVLGSVRQEEEADIVKLICDIRQKNNQIIIGLFPRHMHRLENWEKTFDELSLPWQLRSQTSEKISSGNIVLWDTMGELFFAYKLASAAFVGGSLAPLGGQNFLEPITCGLRPVIGPSWFNFFWIGKEIFEQKLVRLAQNWLEVSEILLEIVSQPLQRKQTQQAISDYVENRRGGTKKVCKAISDLLFD